MKTVNRLPLKRILGIKVRLNGFLSFDKPNLKLYFLFSIEKSPSVVVIEKDIIVPMDEEKRKDILETNDHEMEDTSVKNSISEHHTMAEVTPTTTILPPPLGRLI